MKRLVVLALSVLFLVSCGDEKRRMGPNYDELKPALKLSADQEEKFDDVIAKYEKLREDTFAAAREGGKMDRTAMMEKMEKMMEDQAKELSELLNSDQLAAYKEFIGPMMNRFTPPGYSKEKLEQIVTELELDETQATTLTAINKAFEKSYIDAHDYYHGNNEAAKEYWNKFDEERKKAVEAMVSEEQYAKFLDIVSGNVFRGEHGGGDEGHDEEGHDHHDHDDHDHDHEH